MSKRVQKPTPDGSAPRYRNHLRAWRKHYGFTLDDMAKLTSIDKSSLSRIENGFTQTYIELLNRYSKALHVKPPEILTLGPPDDPTVLLYWRWLNMSKEQREQLLAEADRVAGWAEEATRPQPPWARRVRV